MRSRSIWYLAVVLLIAAGGCAQVERMMGRPTVMGVRPRITDISLSDVSLAFDVDVSNPYPVALKSPKFRYGMDLFGSKFLDAQEATGASLPASGVGTVSLPVKLSYASLADIYKQAAGAKEIPYKLDAALLLPVMGESIELPFSHSGKVPVLQRPTFSNIKVDVADVSFTSAKLSVEADMLNPNVFALGVKELGYLLKLGDVQVGDLVASTADTISAEGSGRVKLNGKISAASAVMRLLQGKDLGLPLITPSGEIETPYGRVRLRD